MQQARHTAGVLWRMIQLVMLGTAVGWLLNGNGAAALGLVLALTVATLWEVERHGVTHSRDRSARPHPH